jgi:lipopolysaccharide/colanic/teichoic acid biosynthesis glycosyltransferase
MKQIELIGRGFRILGPDRRRGTPGWLHALDRPGFLGERAFHDRSRSELRRTERTQHPFALILLDIERLVQVEEGPGKVRELAARLIDATREIDAKGWYRQGKTIGVLLVEIEERQAESLCGHLRAMVRETLGTAFADLVGMREILYPPRDTDDRTGGQAAWETLYGVGVPRHPRTNDLVRRIIDILGSVTAIVVFAPAFVLIPLLIRSTSPGPVLFRQQRLGRYGKPFTFLKFRTMYVNSQDTIHRDYVTEFIKGKVESGAGVYKIRNDPRVTVVGRLLRKTSLDELPQLLNVLRGELSLVGPRPPLSYELASYQLWHTRRILDAKPGLTGPWQVSARSRSTFDDMVRLDIRYASRNSLVRDIRLLVQTPVAMFSMKGAF